MGRPKSPPFTLGTITLAPHPTRQGWQQARGYFKNGHGRRIEATASGQSEAAAKRALQRKVNDARNEHRGGDRQLNQDTKVGAAADVWLDWKSRQRKNGSPLASNTMTDYAGYVRRCVKGSALVSELTVMEVNDIGRIEAWLTDIADTRGETAAKQSRKVLKGILDLAERRGAIPSSVVHRVHTPGSAAGSVGDRKCGEPDCDGDCGKRHLDTKRALTLHEASRVQLQADLSKADIGDLTAFLFGTGARISEALRCVNWDDVDLERQSVRIRGTKSARADRTVRISTELTKRLRHRADLHGRSGQLFGITRYATKIGKPRDRNNVLKSLRLVLNKAGINWAGSHTFRRTVATWMDEAGASLAEIANQLGHADTNVTAAYLGRTAQPTRAAEIMVLATQPHLHAISGE